MSAYKTPLAPLEAGFCSNLNLWAWPGLVQAHSKHCATISLVTNIFAKTWRLPADSHPMTNFSTSHSMKTATPLKLKRARLSSQVAHRFLPSGISLLLLMSIGSFQTVSAQPSLNVRPADFIVAIVNSEPITNNEVQSLKNRLEKQASPGSLVPDAKQLLQQALDQLITEKAQLQLARESGIRIDDAEVDQSELTIARQNQFSKEELHKRLVQDGLTVTSFREQLRTQLTINRLREREVDNRARISDTEAFANSTTYKYLARCRSIADYISSNNI